MAKDDDAKEDDDDSDVIVVVGNAGGNGSGSGMIGYIGSQHSRSGNSLPSQLLFDCENSNRNNKQQTLKNFIVIRRHLIIIVYVIYVYIYVFFFIFYDFFF